MVRRSVLPPRTRIQAVSQLLWPDKDREEWLVLGRNHEEVLGLALHQLRNRSALMLWLVGPMLTPGGQSELLPASRIDDRGNGLCQGEERC
jgi:hypothetical protein